MALSDHDIKKNATHNAMITPFYGETINMNERGQPVTSFGLTSYGYDIRLGRNFIFYRGQENKVINYTVAGGEKKVMFIEAFKTKYPDEEPVIDPNNFDSRLIVQINDVDEIWIPAKTFFLGVSEEYIKVPRNFKVHCDNKSTCARSAIGFFVTPLEPGWEGFITLEFYNHYDGLLKLTTGMGISQLHFENNSECHITYADKKGKYQNQGNYPIPPLSFKKDS